MNMQNTTLFSVVIPLFNKREHIIRTIDSILAQTYSNFEIVIVDDGSTDGSVELVNELRGDSVRLFRQPHSGVSAARNRGVEEANGQIIAFIDADDTWEPHFLDEMIELYKSFPEAKAYASAYQFVEQGNQFLDPKMNFSHQHNHACLLNDYFSISSRGDQPFMMSSFCIQRESFLQLGGFSKELSLAEDKDLFVRVALEMKIAYTPSVLAFYHLDDANRESKKWVPEQECLFSRRVYEAATDIALDAKTRQTMLVYTAAHLLHIASLNIQLGRLDIAKRILADERCKLQPLRYALSNIQYLFKKMGGASESHLVY